jgi:hypothetical protein
MIGFWALRRIETKDVLELKSLELKTHWKQRRFGTKDGISNSVCLRKVINVIFEFESYL